MKWLPRRLLVLFVGVPVAFAWACGTSVLPLFGAYLAWIGIMAWSAREAGRRPVAGKTDRSAGAFMAFLIFGLPPALAWVVARSWRTVLIAYAIWFGLLGLWVLQGLLSRRVTTGEAVGWPVIGAMFLTMAAVPILTLVLRVMGVG